MGKEKLSGALLAAGAVMEFIIAVLHFIWPSFFIQLPEIKNLSAVVKDFIVLASIAIGMCMLIFSFLSYYFSKKIVEGNKTAYIFCITQCIVWLFRLIAEIFLPVRIPLYFIQNPSNIIILLVTVIIIIYVIPLFLIREKIKTAE